jgi:thioredoxin-like negative regulator of GroEL
MEAAVVRLRALADGLGQPTLRWFSLYFSGCGALLRGDLAGVERLAEEAFQIGTEAGQPDAVMVYGAQSATSAVYRGRADEIVELVKAGVAANPGLSTWRAALGSVYVWLGRTEEAAAIVEEAAKDRFEHVPQDPLYLSTLALYAEAAAHTGNGGAAAVLYDLMEPWMDQMVWTQANCYGHACTYVAMVAATCGRDERADELFSHACELQERKGMPLWAARAHLGWAEALAGRGETERAQAEAARALELSREHGYGAIEARASVIAETGSVPSR